jgi:excisionase family DNA binding protein
MAPILTRPRKLISPATGAAYADVSTRTIYRWIADGRLRAFRAGPKLIKIDQAELDRIIQPVPTARDGAA